VVISNEFSASRFWTDIVCWDCTLFQYIGELCRYLLQAPTDPEETRHRLRMCIGNGLRREIWNDFKSRFRIPRILEFYAATEGSVSLFNVDGEPGSLGRIPAFLAHRLPIALVKYDDRTGAPLRDAGNLCIPVAPDEIGEALGRIRGRTPPAGTDFEGYASAEETEQKIIRDAFTPGDAWFRTGDLMRRDRRGYYYFVDRIGDTFRWKGENVSTSEVEQVICSFPGVLQAGVYGVLVPHADGRAGMAAIVAAAELPLDRFYSHLALHLPDFAHPLFLRLCEKIETTATFRNVKEKLAREGYDPAATGDAIFFNDRRKGAFVPLDGALFGRIQSGGIIL
jgi:fatty-acyl-CoA synthase